MRRSFSRWPDGKGCGCLALQLGAVLAILTLITHGTLCLFGALLMLAAGWLWLRRAARDGPDPPLARAGQRPSNKPEPGGELALCVEQQGVLDYVGRPAWEHEGILVTGAAGTGKSALLRELAPKLAGKCAVLAPTGLAAVNVSGQTIHSFIGFPPRLLRYGCKEDLGRRRHAVMRNLQWLIIDEISMVRVDVMDAMDAHLRSIRHTDAPFGGVRLLMFGDPVQLEPVVGEDEDLYIRDTWGSPFFFDAHVWREASFRTFRLEQVHRQVDDPRYAQLLGDIRAGKSDAVMSLNRLVRITPVAPDGAVVLTPRRDVAEQFNRSRLDALPGPQRTYPGRIEGQFGRDALPAEMHLSLKVGARVMVLRNSSCFVNGDLGVVQELAVNQVNVRLQKNGDVVQVVPVSWESIRYEYDRETAKIEPRVIGRFWQLPLRLAWALTIHKAQGLTLDRVHVDFGKGMFAHGQAYVAITRCRRSDQLSLSRSLQPTDLIWHDRVGEFLDHVGNDPVWRLVS